MFRNPHIEAKEKENAELRDKLEEAKVSEQKKSQRLEKVEQELAEFRQSKRPKSKPIPQPEPGRIPSYRKWKFSLLRIPWPFLAMGLIFLGLTIWWGFHYFTDIQEGVVTSKEHHPIRTICNDNGCTTTPESWTVDIAYQDRTATWSISEDEYNHTQRGRWFCYTDMLHPRNNCGGPEN